MIVKYGGRLCQNIPRGHGYSTEYRGELVHVLNFTNKFRDLEIAAIGKKKEKVVKGNSLHHQGAYKDMVPECFDIVCSTKDGITEMICHRELPIAGYQGHVEEDYNYAANLLIKELISRSPNYIKDEVKGTKQTLSD